MARIITVTSGKGGVGKTSIGVNTAVALAGMGKRVCLFDADLGLANVNILLGIYPEYDLADVVSGTMPLSDIIIRDCFGIDIIPGSTGVERLADLDEAHVAALIEGFGALTEYDFIIVDTSAGISRSVIAFCLAAAENILVLTPEPTSMTDGYALLKILSLNGYRYPVMVAVNQCASVRAARIVFDLFQDTVKKYLPVKLLLLGPVAKDPRVARGIVARKPFLTLYPRSLASRCIRRIAELLLRKKYQGQQEFDRFLTKCLGAFKDAVKVPPSSGKAAAGGGASPVKDTASEGHASSEGSSPGEVNIPESGAEEASASGAAAGEGEYAARPHAPPLVRGSVFQVLGRLEAKVDTLSRELARMREMMEDLSAHTAVPDAAEIDLTGYDAVGKDEEPLRIALDFEAYVNRRKNPKPQKTME